MKPLYLSSAVREGLGSCLRPGGLALTERILHLLSPGSAGVALDAGCGAGGSMTAVREATGMEIFGLDLDAGLLKAARREGHYVARGDLAALPMADAVFDLILCECVWNLTVKEKVLAEFARILKPGGMLAIADMYSRSGDLAFAASWPVRCCFSAAVDLASIERQVLSAGFTLKVLEDHTPLLRKTAAEFVFTHGSLQKFWEAVTGNTELAAAACDAAATTKPGMFLLIAQRNTL